MKAGMVLRCVAVAVVCCTMMVGCKKGCKPRSGGLDTKVDETGATRVGDGDGGSVMAQRGDKFSGPQTRNMFQPVLFAYDSAAINPSEQFKIQLAADYLKNTAGKAVIVEGHCDERGTNEYNRTLGERRAQAVRDALVNLGVDSSNIQTKSLGEDMPVDPGHDEAAWDKNRRAEFVIVN